ncbi:MAG TPA: efflux RND transporter permease subunit [Bacteroidota bacterium]|nr:efflux RND transporter permease subunit [Bacteroidota bacterium]
MKIVNISIKNPVFITMVILLIIVMGLLSYTRIGVDLLPDISLPIVAVTTVNPGVGPEEIEQQISKPIEDIISSLNGIKKVSSTSSEGISIVTAEFDLGIDADKAASDVREKISSIRSSLPRDILEPIIDKFDPAAAPILSFAIVSDKLNLPELRNFVEDSIKTKIERLNGVGSVTVIGGLEREIHIDVNINKINSLNIPISQISQAIKNENLNLPAGRLTEKTIDFLIRTKAEFKTVKEIENIPVGIFAGNTIFLKDVAKVYDDFKTKKSISRVNNKESITIVIRKQSGTNSVQVAEEVKKQMSKIQSYSPNISIIQATDESEFIQEAKDDVLNSLIEGAILAGIVVLFSFGDFRNTLITIIGLPVCIIGTFAVMNYLGFTLNVITLLGLSLSVGLLIDDAIVVRENIFRHMEKLGKDPMKAAYEGTTEVALAVMATTFTIVAVFLPVSFATGIAGKFFKEFGITVAAAVLISLFEAFTFAPMLSAYFFRKVKHDNPNKFSNKFQNAISKFYNNLGNNYKPLLKWSLTHRGSIVIITTIIFFASIYLFNFIGTGGSPKGDRPDFNIIIQAQSGSSLENTDKIVKEIESILFKEQNVEYVFSVIGNTDGSSDEATMNVKLNTRGITKQFQDYIRPKLANITGATISFQESSAIGGAAASAIRQLPIQINLRGNNLENLMKASEIVKSSLKEIQGLVDINTDYRTPKPEIIINIDRDRANRLGVNTFQIANAMKTVIDGDVASKFRSGEKLIDIRVRAEKDIREDFENISNIFISSKNGLISLNQIATLSISNGPTQIKRNERTRQITVAANTITGTAVNEIKNKIDNKLRNINLPKDVTYIFGGQVEQTGEQFQSLFISLILAVIFVYMVLASQFNSFTQPFSIMLALPLSIIGAIIALLVGNKLFDTVAFIGLIMLMGLVTKNSILLIDFTNVLRKKGYNRFDAIVEAGSTRLRPIIMTTLAMILGMVPVAFGFGTSTDFRAPIGYTIIGGLISSTLLTLVIVPVVYSLIDDITMKFKKKSI